MDGGGMAGTPGLSQTIGSAAIGTVGLVQFAIGMSQAAKDAKIADERYSNTAEFNKSWKRAEDMAKSGFTQDEINAYLQNQARINNTRFQKGVDVGGNNFANAVQQGVNYGNLSSLLNFAAKDAALRRSNIQYADTFTRENQRRADMNTTREMVLRDQKRAAIAKLVDSGVQNFTTSSAMWAGGTGNPTGSGGGDVYNQRQPVSTQGAVDTPIDQQYNPNPSMNNYVLNYGQGYG